MPLPTLLREGYIVPNAKFSSHEKKRIKNMVSVEYILEFIGDRTPRLGGPPRYPAKTPGDKVIILKSDTGSGKSTVLPPSLYEAFQERTRKNIAVTQPRVLTAVDIATGLPEFYPFLQMDVNLGYSTGNYKRLPSGAGILYMTIGTLLQQIKSFEAEKFMKKYSFILIDEVHDRDLNIDMTLYLIKKFLAENYTNVECPMLILMSATFNPKTFADYFGCPHENYIQVVGSTFPIEPNFLKYDSQDYIQSAVDIAERIHVENIADITEDSMYRDIIIFVSGGGEIKKIIEKLNIFNSEVLSSLDVAKKYIENKKTGGNSYYVAPIDLSRTSYSESGDEYQKLFSDIKDITIPIYESNNGRLGQIKKWVNPSRRIIVATPVAETGVTIDTLKYCIDTGFFTDVPFNPHMGMTMLMKKNVTRGMATQRRGRVGRKSPGFWYPCFTKKTFESLQEDQFAEILRGDITETINDIIVTETDAQIIESKGGFKIHKLSDNTEFKLVHNDMMNMSKVDFLESPAASSLIYSVEKLRILGFIDNEHKPTELGLFSKKIQKIKIENKRMLFAAYAHGANVLDIITIIAFIEVGKRFVFHRKYKPINPTKMDEKQWEFFYKVAIADELVEFVLVWEAYSEFLNKYVDSIKKKVDKGKEFSFDVSKIREWCSDNKLLYDGLLYVTTIRDEIIESVIEAGMNPYYNGLGIDKGQYNLLDMLRTDMTGFVDEVKKIKKCVLDGYRCNLIVWDGVTRKYIIKHRNLPVFVKSNIITRMGDNAVQRKPNFIISTDLLFRQSFITKNYEAESTGGVSVLDSYVNVDLDFVN